MSEGGREVSIVYVTSKGDGHQLMGANCPAEHFTTARHQQNAIGGGDVSSLM